MNVHQLLGQAAALFALVSAMMYARSVVRGHTKPNRASWLIWVAVNCSLVFSYHFSGATTTIWINIAYVLTSITIFLLSLKYGIGGYEALDVFCLLGAALGLGLWWATDNPVIALYLNVLMDALGFVPTIKKAYAQPQSESRLAWNVSTFSNVLNVMALTTWQFKIALFPIYNLTFNALVAGLLEFRRAKRHRTAI